MLLQALPAAAQRETAQLAIMRCAATALAVERYRLAHAGRIPDSLATLTPALLPTIPLDPFDGRPLRFRSRASGYVVYSIGPDLTDDGGKEHQRGQTNDPRDMTFIVEK